MKKSIIILLFITALFYVPLTKADDDHGASRVITRGVKTNVANTWTAPQTFNSVTINDGSIAGNETLGGVSTFVITGNLTITDPLMLSGRPVEINATASPIITLPALANGSVTPQVIFQDITKAGNDSGVTIRSASNYIHSGIGSTYTSGGTIFVNSGNTGYMLVLKAFNYGSGVTPSWRVVSFSGNTLRRP